MKVYKVKHKTLQSGTVVWHNIRDIIDEVFMHLREGDVGDEIEVSIGEMTEKEYDNLSEFEGY